MGNNMNPSVTITVSCHKPFCVPRSSLYLPIHVGSATSSLSIDGAQRDDEGDNISARNFSYCELTGQYWAWKNLSSDYIGQCHYRRYFAFSRPRCAPNDHAQYEIPLLNQSAIRDLQLDNTELILSKVTKYDVIVPKTWSVSCTMTPSGVKRTVREHMVGYGLVSDEMLDRLMSLTSRLAPTYLEDVVSYLDGHTYLGYNCFIMKRELFHKLCEFEFPVLAAFDETFSYEGLSSQQKRACGYFGEILFSAFINHISRDRSLRIVHVPMVFFEHTDPEDAEPSEDAPSSEVSTWKTRILPLGSRRRLWAGMFRNYITGLFS